MVDAADVVITLRSHYQPILSQVIAQGSAETLISRSSAGLPQNIIKMLFTITVVTLSTKLVPIHLAWESFGQPDVFYDLL